ncbi:MAG: nucleotidyltransferase family protein [Planctomycetes bacterium]|nr:nucleotidyltransferase family protein [Planctomycetota bacterium]
MPSVPGAPTGAPPGPARSLLLPGETQPELLAPAPAPEAIFLRRLCALEPGAPALTPLALGFDWRRFLALGAAHRLLPVAWPRWREAGRDDALPADARRAAEGVCLEARVQQERVEQVARVVSRALDERGLSWSLLGGVAFHRRVYQPGERVFTDLDLLVATEDLGAARRALFTAGARRLTPSYENVLLLDDVPLDLHAEPTEAGRIFSVRFAWFLSARETLARARRREVAPGLVAPVPDPIDEFLLLAAHFVKHSFLRWVWALDLHRLARDARHPLDWPTLASRARRSGLQRALGAVFPVVGALFSAPRAGPLWPPGLVRADIAPRPAGLARFVVHRAASRPLARGGDILTVLAARSLPLRARLMAETLFPGAKVLRETFGLHRRARPPARLRLFRAVRVLAAAAADLRASLFHPPP